MHPGAAGGGLRRGAAGGGEPRGDGVGLGLGGFPRRGSDGAGHPPALPAAPCCGRGGMGDAAGALPAPRWVPPGPILLPPGPIVRPPGGRWQAGAVRVPLFAPGACGCTEGDCPVVSTQPPESKPLPRRSDVPALGERCWARCGRQGCGVTQPECQGNRWRSGGEAARLASSSSGAQPPRSLRQRPSATACVRQDPLLLCLR